MHIEDNEIDTITLPCDVLQCNEQYIMYVIYSA